jgi:membrane protease YdiL (CAAX protease family)
MKQAEPTPGGKTSGPQPSQVADFVRVDGTRRRTNRRKIALLGSFMAGFFALWTFRATSLYAIDEAIASPILRALYSNMVKLLIWVLPAVGFVYWGEGTSPTKYLGLVHLPQPDQWRPCLLATAAFLVATAAFELSVAGKAISLAPLTLPPLIIGLISSPLFEEILFRGLVLKELMSLLPLTFANMFTSVLFVAAHLPYWLSHGGLTRSMMANCAGIFLFSLLAGWLFARSKSIWPPTLAHIANNLLASLLI